MAVINPLSFPAHTVSLSQEHLVFAYLLPWLNPYSALMSLTSVLSQIPEGSEGTWAPSMSPVIFLIPVCLQIPHCLCPVQDLTQWKCSMSENE